MKCGYCHEEYVDENRHFYNKDNGKYCMKRRKSKQGNKIE